MLRRLALSERDWRRAVEAVEGGTVRRVGEMMAMRPSKSARRSSMMNSWRKKKGLTR